MAYGGRSLGSSPELGPRAKFDGGPETRASATGAAVMARGRRE